LTTQQSCEEKSDFATAARKIFVSTPKEPAKFPAFYSVHGRTSGTKKNDIMDFIYPQYRFIRKKIILFVYEGDYDFFLVGRVGRNSYFVLAGEPSESGVEFFVFEFGNFLKLFNTKGIGSIKCYPNRAGIGTDNFCVHCLYQFS